MSYRELYTSITTTFSGSQRDFKDSDYVILGVPFDATSTYRTGSRFAPLAIREASLNIETYSFISDIDLAELRLHDAGDLHVTGNVEETLKRLGLVIRDLLSARKVPVLIGGEHTITLGAIRGLDKDVAVVSFDAHLDLRDEYMDQKVCHATFMRRIKEEMKNSKIIEVGTRAASRDEIQYAKTHEIQFFTSQEIMHSDLEETSKEINSLLEDYEKIYITVDMDVLDPAFAPAVQNPEPNGLPTFMLMELLTEVCDHRTIAFDIVEATPHYDCGTTAIQAAKIIFESLCSIEKERRAFGSKKIKRKFTVS